MQTLMAAPNGVPGRGGSVRTTSSSGPPPYHPVIQLRACDEPPFVTPASFLHLHHQQQQQQQQQYSSDTDSLVPPGYVQKLFELAATEPASS
jgi:hypothetical protein